MAEIYGTVEGPGNDKETYLETTDNKEMHIQGERNEKYKGSNKSHECETCHKKFKKICQLEFPLLGQSGWIMLPTFPKS